MDKFNEFENNMRTEMDALDLISPLTADQEFYAESLSSVTVFYDYWASCRKDRSMPRRQDIDPIDFPKHLPGILLIDVLPDRPIHQQTEVFRYRVVGTREVDNRKHNPTGRFVEDGFFAEDLVEALRAYQSVRIYKQPVYEQLTFVSDRGLPIDEHSVVLPISEDGQKVSQIIVYSEASERRFD